MGRGPPGFFPDNTPTRFPKFTRRSDLSVLKRSMNGFPNFKSLRVNLCLTNRNRRPLLHFIRKGTDLDNRVTGNSTIIRTFSNFGRHGEVNRGRYPPLQRTVPKEGMPADVGVITLQSRKAMAMPNKKTKTDSYPVPSHR